MNLKGERRFLTFTLLIVTMNVMCWGANFKYFPDYFKLITIPILVFTLSLYVYLKAGDRIARRKENEQDRTWVKKTSMTMKDWMNSNPY